MSSAKNAARAAITYINSMEEGYGYGSSADNLLFGKHFAGECVNQIINKLNDMPQAKLEDLNNEFTKLLKVTSGLNDSEFAYGVDLFKNALKQLEEKIPAVTEFFVKENITEVTNEFYNVANSNNTHKYDTSTYVFKMK